MAREIGHMLGTILFFETKALLQGKPMSRKRSTNKFYRPQSFRNLWISILAFWLLIITICNYVNYGSHPRQLGWNHFFSLKGNSNLIDDWGGKVVGGHNMVLAQDPTPQVCVKNGQKVCMCVCVCIFVFECMGDSILQEVTIH